MHTAVLVPGDSFGQTGLISEEFDSRFANVAASSEGDPSSIHDRQL